MPAQTVKKVRCPWCPPGDKLYELYHDEEWGVPERDGGRLFAMLNLEGAQAGLNWRTILGKREGYYKVFVDFDVQKLTRWSETKILAALKDERIVRNRLKVRGVIRNAKAVQAVFGGDLDAFSDFLWSFVDGVPIQSKAKKFSDIPAETAESRSMSKALKKNGFTFVGPTICYAFMQAVGMVNDHTKECFRYKPVAALAEKRFIREVRVYGEKG